MFLGLEALVFHLIQGHISDLLHLVAASLTYSMRTVFLGIPGSRSGPHTQVSG